jgi:thiol-disulfide isomerase/thioredoxin
MARALGIALLLMACAAAGFAGYRFLSAQARPSHAAVDRRPDFTLNDLAGKPKSISEWDGKVLVVNFWASWCEPCRREIPLLNALQSEYGGRGVQVIGVAIDELASVQSFVQSVPISYPVLIGEQEAVDALAGFGAEMTVLPYTAFVRRDGHIELLHAGELQRGEATDLLERLLRGGPG